VADRHDAMLKLKENVKELEEKHKETLATVNHRGEVIKQLRDELKQNNHRVRIMSSKLYSAPVYFASCNKLSISSMTRILMIFKVISKICLQVNTNYIYLSDIFLRKLQ